MQPGSLAIRVPVRVGATVNIIVETNRYSIPVEIVLYAIKWVQFTEPFTEIQFRC